MLQAAGHRNSSPQSRLAGGRPASKFSPRKSAPAASTERLRPQQCIGRLLCVGPDVITSETDMFQAERRHVRDNRRCDNDALPIRFNKRLFLDER